MHDVHAEPGVPDEDGLQGEGAVQPSPVALRAQVDHTGGARTDVNPHRDVEFFRQRPVGGHPWVVGRDPRVLIRDLRQNLDPSRLHEAPK